LLTHNMVAGDVPIENILKYYEEITRDNVILMLMRCKKLFDARIEVKKIVKLLISHLEHMERVRPLLANKKSIYSDQEIQVIRLSHRVVQKLESALSMFKDDHKMFRTRFLFGGKDLYIEIPKLLRKHSKAMRNAHNDDESIGDLSSEQRQHTGEDYPVFHSSD
jgi:hypothetical protein